MLKKIAKTRRLVWVDVIRVVAIYLVVLVHTSTLTANPMDIMHSWPYILSFSLAKVSVPLFVMLSGALLLGKKEIYSAFFRKRATKVFVPWIAWTLIYMAWNYVAHGYQPANFSQWKYFFELTLLSNLWFLPLIFSLYLMTPILRILIPFVSKSDKIYLSTIWLLFVCIIPYFHTGTSFPLSQASGLVPVAFYYSGYFMIGYFLTNSKLPKKMVRRSLGIVLLGIALTFIELGLTKGNGMVEHQLKFFDYFAPGIAVTSIGVFLFLYSYFRNLKISPTKQRLLFQLGSASLGIYIVHGLLSELLGSYINQLLNFLPSIPLLHGYAFALILFSLSFAFVFLLKKIPIVRFIVP